MLRASMSGDNDGMKRGVKGRTMADCDTCNNLEWDEDEQEYYCSADVDEDDYGRMLQEQAGGHPHQRCPYWVNGDEYAVARHQAF